MTEKIFCLPVVWPCRFLWNFNGLIWLLGCCYQFSDLSNSTGSVRRRFIKVPITMVKAMPVFRYFDYGRSAEFVQGKKGDPSSSCNVVYPGDKYPVNFIATQVRSVEPPGSTIKTGSILVAHAQEVLKRLPPEIIPTYGLWHGYDVIWQPGPS